MRRKIVNLTEVSHRSHLDLNTAVPWAEGIDKGLTPKRPETSWIYGTPAWEALTPSQRHELAWVENARDVSMFIWLEQALPPLYIGYINRLGHLLPEYMKDYLLVFSGEEIVHIQVFRRYMEIAGLNPFSPPEGIHELYVEGLPNLPPIMGLIATLLVEWVAENGTQQCVSSEGVEQLTRRMFCEHHREELRHISFARWVIESLVAGAPAGLREQLREFTESITARVVPQFTLNEEIADRVSFDLGFARNDRVATDLVRSSSNNLRLNRERFAPILGWLRKTGLIGPEFTIPCVPMDLLTVWPSSAPAN